MKKATIVLVVFFVIGSHLLLAQNRPKAEEQYNKAKVFYLKFTLKDLQQSVKQYEKALEADSLYVPAWAGLAQSYSLIGFEMEKKKQSGKDYFQKSIQYGKKAVALDSNSAHAHRALAQAYMNADSSHYADQAYRELLESLSLDTMQAETFYFLWMHTQNDNPESPLIKKALSLDDGYFMSHYSVAVSFSKKKMFEQAVEHYKKCVKLSPDHAMPYFGLGNAYSQLKQYSSAIREYESAIKLDPEYPDSYLYIGLAHYYLGEDKSAIKQLEAFLKKVPGSSYRSKVESILKEIKK
jgi:tetratricopeptide (TPR) repeat protein